MRARLAAAKVGIAGCGGLGSNCAASLVRAGVGSLVLADFDLVSEANLDRQFFFKDQVGEPKALALAENLLRIDPALALDARVLRLDAASALELFADCDVVVEAFDDAGAKAMLLEAMLGRAPGKWLVAASGLAGYGRSGALKVRASGRFVLCGDLETEVGPESPPVAPRVGIVANMEANAVLSILLDGGAGEEA